MCAPHEDEKSGRTATEMGNVAAGSDDSTGVRSSAEPCIACSGV